MIDFTDYTIDLQDQTNNRIEITVHFKNDHEMVFEPDSWPSNIDDYIVERLKEAYHNGVHFFHLEVLNEQTEESL